MGAENLAPPPGSDLRTVQLVASRYSGLKLKQSHYRLGQALRFQEFEAPRFHDTRHIMSYKIWKNYNELQKLQQYFLLSVYILTKHEVRLTASKGTQSFTIYGHTSHSAMRYCLYLEIPESW
jgi:hypothetical protein